jgi:AcrR family transcriptional regulator
MSASGMVHGTTRCGWSVADGHNVRTWAGFDGVEVSVALQYPSAATYSPTSTHPRVRVERSSTVRQDAGKRRTEILRVAASIIASSGPHTSLHEIANAAGILPGSLYHHFESKEAITVELTRGYHADLDRIAEVAYHRLDEPGPGTQRTAIAELSAAIANCAVAHRAAVQMSFFEAPVSDPEFIESARRRPVALQRAMLETLRAGRWSGYIKSDIDLALLADQMVQTLLHVGLEVIGPNDAAEIEATVLCSIFLDGLAQRPPSDTQLDQSAPIRAANNIIQTWTDMHAHNPKDKVSILRAIARKEFGRRGYELTTVRNIAAAAGLGIGTVYRLIGHKEALLGSIMRSFGATVGEGFVSVLGALTWVNIKSLEAFPDEWTIQLAWMRQSPPNAANPGLHVKTRMRQLRTLLVDGIQREQISKVSPAGLLSPCVMDVLWMPENIVREAGPRAAHAHFRNTVLRGIVAPNP